MSQAIFLTQSSFKSIDWSTIAAWDSEDRYTPTGTITVESAVARIDEVERLCTELSRDEAVESLGLVDATMTAKGRPLNALVFDRRQDGAWRVFVAAVWLNSDSVHRDVMIAIAAAMLEDLHGLYVDVEAVNAEHPLAHPFYAIGDFVDVGGSFHVDQATVYVGPGYRVRHRPRQQGILLVTRSRVDGLAVEEAFVIVADAPPN